MLIIVATLLSLWLSGTRSNFVPCIQDCGETFIAQHAVVNFRLYGFKYGLLEDRATLPDVKRWPYLYSHNPNIAGVLFPLLDKAGLRPLWSKQLLTLVAFGVGLFYVFRTVAYVSQSALAGLCVLVLFSTDFSQVLAFGLNALRAWHWLALFGMSFHVCRLSLERERYMWWDRFAIFFFTLIAFGIGYEFLAICAFVSLFIVMFCSTRALSAVSLIGWIGLCIAVVFLIRQIQVAAVLGVKFWYTDILYSAVIKVTGLSEYVNISSFGEIDRYYEQYGVFRPGSAPAPISQLWLGLQMLFIRITLPTVGLTAAVIGGLIAVFSATLTALYLADVIVRNVPKILAACSLMSLKPNDFRKQPWWSTDVATVARFYTALVVGICCGLFVFGALSLSIYLKHQFPLTAALFLFPKGLVLAGALGIGLVWWRAGKRRGLIVLAVGIAIIVDHGVVQVENLQAMQPMSVGWIPAVKERAKATFAVSWIPSSVAGFTRNGVIGVRPGLEKQILERIERGEPPFTVSDLTEMNPLDARESSGINLLRPDYWLYFRTDHRAEIDGTVPACRRSYSEVLVQRMLEARRMPQANDFWVGAETTPPGRPVAFGGRLNVSGLMVSRVEVLRSSDVIIAVNVDCFSREFKGVLRPPANITEGSVPLRVEAIFHDGRRFEIHRFSLTIDSGAAASRILPGVTPNRQATIEEMLAANRRLRVAARGPDYVIFDLRSLWGRP